MAYRTDDNPTIFGEGNGCLGAKLILLVLFSFGYAIHLRLMNTVHLVTAVLPLTHHTLEDLEQIGIPAENGKR